MLYIIISKQPRNIILCKLSTKKRTNSGRKNVPEVSRKLQNDSLTQKLRSFWFITFGKTEITATFRDTEQLNLPALSRDAVTSRPFSSFGHRPHVCDSAYQPISSSEHVIHVLGCGKKKKNTIKNKTNKKIFARIPVCASANGVYPAVTRFTGRHFWPKW